MNGQHCPECQIDWPATLLIAVIILAVILFWIAAVTFVMRALAADSPPRCTESGLVASGPSSGIGSAITCVDP